MADRERREHVVQRLIGEIGRGTGRSDHVAAMIHIHDAVRRRDITARDAERLMTFLTAIHGDRLADYVH